MFVLDFDVLLLNLTCNDVEHSGVEDGWTDQSQEDEAAG